MQLDFKTPDSFTRKELQQLIKEHQQKYSEEYIRANALADAEKQIPALKESEPAPFERELLYAAESAASSIATHYKGPLERLDAQIKAEKEFVDREYKTTHDKVEAIYQAEKEAAEDAFGLKDAHKQLELAEQHYHELKTRLGRTPVVYIPGVLYWIFAFCIFAGEIPLNALVFQIFGENQVMTWVMAFVIGLSIPLSAHFIGVKFREHEGRVSWANMFKGCVGLFVVVAALYGLSLMRTTYLGEFREALGLTETLVKSSFMFFWLNIAVLGAAVMIAYLSHDPLPGFHESKSEVDAARRRVEKKEIRRVKLLKRCAENRASKLENANRDHRDGLNKIIHLKGMYDQLLKEGQEFESRCLDRLRRDISLYRTENLRKRDDKETPASFRSFPEIIIELSKMAEKLNNTEENGNAQA